jgi:hypothetical protein
MKARITFDAQAWLNDYAISVDPQGDTVWVDEDVPPGVESFTYESNELARSEHAPLWVQNWSGPFSIEVEYLPVTQ